MMKCTETTATDQHYFNARTVKYFYEHWNIQNSVYDAAHECITSQRWSLKSKVSAALTHDALVTVNRIKENIHFIAQLRQVSKKIF